MMNNKWTVVTRHKPCPACNHHDWCAFAPDGVLKCERTTEGPPGYTRVKDKDQGALFKPVGDRLGSPLTMSRRSKTGAAPRPTAAAAGLDWTAELEASRQGAESAVLRALAADLGVAEASLHALECGWLSQPDLRRLKAGGAGWSEQFPDGAFCFPERDGSRRVVGLSLRATDGRKGAPSGASRGLVIPAGIPAGDGVVMVVEGASDVAACHTLGIRAVGRPSNSGGVEHLAMLLKGRSVVIMGERDRKPDGRWPGRDGATAVAEGLASMWERDVKWGLPPEGFKDVRAWLKARVAQGLDLNDTKACHAAGDEFRKAIVIDRVVAAKEQGRLSDAESIVQLAEQRYRFGRSPGDLLFAVPVHGPKITTMLRGSSDALRATLAWEFRTVHGRTPSSTALTDAMTVLQGIALDADLEPLGLRLAEHEGNIVIDLGGPDGRAVVVSPGGWEVIDTPPVLFRRTALTDALPEPIRGGDLKELRALLNVGDESWVLALGWLVAALMPSIPHPVLMLGGLQGVGKTMAASFLVGLVDPSTIENHNVPRDAEAWAMAASGSWAVLVDNVSTVHEWWADALCKTVTGAGYVKRRLYSDSDLSVLSFRRVVALTSIDAGALRGDLGERLLILDLEVIDDTRRRDERELRAMYDKGRPAMLGALLDLLSKVLQVLPEVQLESRPRMADFARVLAAMDRVLGTDALQHYIGQRVRVAADVTASDPVGEAIIAFLDKTPEWYGRLKELLPLITPSGKVQGWPQSECALAGRVRRLMPALALQGIQIALPPKSDKTRRYRLRRTAQTARPPEIGLGEAAGSDVGRAVGRAVETEHADRPNDRPEGQSSQHPSNQVDASEAGRSGGSGGPPHLPSPDLPDPSSGRWGVSRP